MGSQRKTKSPFEADAQRFMETIRAIDKCVRGSSRKAEMRLGISNAQLLVLSELQTASAKRLGELATRTGTDPSSVSVVVDQLARKGLVDRKTAPGDARRIEIRLSPRGRSMLRTAPKTSERVIANALAALAQRERRALLDQLDLVCRAMQIAPD